MQGAVIVLALLGITSGKSPVSPVYCKALLGLLALQNTISWNFPREAMGIVSLTAVRASLQGSVRDSNPGEAASWGQRSWSRHALRTTAEPGLVQSTLCCDWPV